MNLRHDEIKYLYILRIFKIQLLTFLFKSGLFKLITTLDI